MRLIDVDTLGVDKCSNDVLSEAYCKGWNAMVYIVNNAPVVDAVVVTRCKDCKHAYINSFSAASGVALCTLSGQPMQQDDFCSYGEPKEDVT